MGRVRLQGHNYFRIMKATGHKTLSVLKRHNTVTRDVLKALLGKNLGGIFTYIFTINWKTRKESACSSGDRATDF